MHLCINKMNISYEENKKIEDTLPEISISLPEKKLKGNGPTFPWDYCKIVSISFTIAIVLLFISVQAFIEEKDFIKAVLLLFISLSAFLFSLIFTVRNLVGHIIPRLQNFRRMS